ncbi:MAG: sugar transferase [Nitrospira sp.]|nr:sugar transferase [Nitrospira sp.]MDR4465268.1 sugar transferase [Nitrospira sp.]
MINTPQPTIGNLFPGKRAVDLVVTLSLLPLLFPVIGFTALATWVFHGWPLFFAQERPGLHGRPFMLYKFRTMTNARGTDGELLPDTDRLTRFGKLMRSTSLDELPELFNVVKGEMSLVGPRPLLMEYLERYSPEQHRRHRVPPGLTGWAQINGRNNTNWNQRFLLDLWYVDHRSLWLDCKILLMTPWKVLKREGVTHPDDPSWEGKFKGTPSDPLSR